MDRDDQSKVSARDIIDAEYDFDVGVKVLRLEIDEEGDEEDRDVDEGVDISALIDLGAGDAGVESGGVMIESAMVLAVAIL